MQMCQIIIPYYEIRYIIYHIIRFALLLRYVIRCKGVRDNLSTFVSATPVASVSQARCKERIVTSAVLCRWHFIAAELPTRVDITEYLVNMASQFPPGLQSNGCCDVGAHRHKTTVDM